MSFICSAPISSAPRTRLPFDAAHQALLRLFVFLGFILSFSNNAHFISAIRLHASLTPLSRRDLLNEIDK